jgi:hypothetical protein
MSRRPPTIQYEVSDIELMARAIAGSKLFGITTPEQALALCLIAQSEGRHPASAAQDYHIIQNKPSKKADAMLRDFLNAGGKVEWHTLDDTTADATFTHPSGGSARITWDMARAKKAQLTTPMWSKYPRQMLRSRTVSEGVRTIYPMATSGMYVPEEVQEFAPQIEGQVAEPKPRVRDGSDGNPKSSRQAKLAGDWEITKEIAALASNKEVDDWLELHAVTIAAYNKTWRDQLDEMVEAKREELAKPAEKLSAHDSGILLKSLSTIAKQCDTQTALRTWVRAKETKTSINSLVETDYLTFSDLYEAQLGELPE